MPDDVEILEEPLGMLTVKEAGERLRLSMSTIYALCGQGRILHHRCGAGGGAIRIAEKDLLDFLARSRVTARGNREVGVRNFSCLDSGRLAAAWRRQAVVSPAPPLGEGVRAGRSDEDKLYSPCRDSRGP